MRSAFKMIRLNVYVIALLLCLPYQLIHFSTALKNGKDNILPNYNARYLSRSYLTPDQSIKVPTPSIPSKNIVETRSGIFTGGTVQVSGYFLRIPADIESAIAKAKSEKASLEITAVHLEASGATRFTDIPEVKVMAHTCSFRNVYFYTQSTKPAYTYRTAPNGRTPSTPPSVPSSGNVNIYCANIVSNEKNSYLRIYTYGHLGIRGGSGGKGYDGRNGTPGSKGRCKKKRFLGIRIKCTTTRGYKGRLSTSGADGARGSRGGSGGRAGSVRLAYGSITGTQRLNVLSYTRGGSGGYGGLGGSPGKNGITIASISYITRCRSKCREVLENENRPALRTPRRGSTGIRGTKGSDATTYISKVPSISSHQIDAEHLADFLTMAERYYNDVVLAKGACEEAVAVMDTVVGTSLIAKSANTYFSRYTTRVSSHLYTTISERAQTLKKSLLLRKTIFGPAVLSRRAPTPIKDELETEMRYVKALGDQISSLKTESNIIAVVTEGASISIPATNFKTLKQDLLSQRDTFKRAVLDTETRIEHSSADIQSSVERYIFKKKDEADLAKQDKLFKAIGSILKIGVGIASLNFKEIFSSTKAIIGTIKDIKVSFEDIEKIKSTAGDIKDAFKSLKNETKAIKDLLNTALDISDNINTVKDAFSKAEATGCSFDEIKKLMQAAPDRIDKFPNLVDFDMDFSTIDDIGVVGELTSALISIRADKLTDQFSCIFGERLDEIPSVKVAFDNFFTLTSARVDILARMVDVDIELRKISVIEQGVNLQKEQLDRLRTGSKLSTRRFIITATSATFESARMKAIEIMERLADSYGNIVLKDLGKVFKKYAENRLGNNGRYGLIHSGEYSNLLRVEADLKKEFRTAHSCATESAVPASSFYSFDITKNNYPDVFLNGPGTGPDNTTSINLDITKDCAFYYGNEAPKPMLVNNGISSPVCRPNAIKYNARLVSIGLEFIGGDDSMLPVGKNSISASLEQTGRQVFHTKPAQYKSLEMAPLQFWLGYVPLRSTPNVKITYNPTCFLGDGGLRSVNLDSPRVCPSPFSSYSLQLGFGKDSSIEKYLASVTAIRIHTQIVAYANRYTAIRCFG